MRIRTHRAGAGCDLDRSTAPMVDVVFQLLVFFVLASAGRIAEQSLAAPLSAGTLGAVAIQPADKQSEVWIHLSRSKANKRITVELAGRKHADFAALAKALRATSLDPAKSLIILDIAGDVPIADMIGAYDACLSAGHRSINFAASPDEIAFATTSSASRQQTPPVFGERPVSTGR
jgi:biopolymer transport protein ExbD